jgi:hypothetical protein
MNPARRLRVVSNAPPAPTPDPEEVAKASRLNPKWGRLSAPTFAADSQALAFWLSRCTADLRASFQLTDLRALARAIRANR